MNRRELLKFLPVVGLGALKTPPKLHEKGCSYCGKTEKEKTPEGIIQRKWAYIEFDFSNLMLEGDQENRRICSKCLVEGFDRLFGSQNA